MTHAKEYRNPYTPADTTGGELPGAVYGRRADENIGAEGENGGLSAEDSLNGSGEANGTDGKVSLNENGEAKAPDGKVSLNESGGAKATEGEISLNGNGEANGTDGGISLNENVELKAPDGEFNNPDGEIKDAGAAPWEAAGQAGSLDLRLSRLRLGVTQTALAMVLGVDRRTVQNWESGKRIPRSKIPTLLSALDAIAEARRDTPADARGRRTPPPTEQVQRIMVVSTTPKPRRGRPSAKWIEEAGGLSRGEQYQPYTHQGKRYAARDGRGTDGGPGNSDGEGHGLAGGSFSGQKDGGHFGQKDGSFSGQKDGETFGLTDVGSYGQTDGDRLGQTFNSSYGQTGGADRDGRVPARRRGVPFYDGVVSIGGVNERAALTDAAQAPTDYIDTGDWFRDATAAIRHYGDSMAEYPSGCILAVKEVLDRRLIVPGKDYVIETAEYRVTKRVQLGARPDRFTAYSTNRETYADGRLVHEPFDIRWSSVRRIFCVLGYVVKNDGGTIL